MTSTTAIAPAAISPRRDVPASIARPEYVDKPAPAPFTGSEVKDAETIERIRVACRLAARARELVGSQVAPGVTTDELDRIGHEFLCDHGAYPSTLGYKAFPKSLCSSVNEVVCHGIPDARVIEDGDIVNIDITAYINGVHGDTNATFLVGEVDDDSLRLVQVTRECLDKGIAAVKPGGTVRDIGRAIQAHAEGHGYGVVRAFVGHGIGRAFHSEPQVFHYDNPQARQKLEPGMTFTIEPMITIGDWRHEMWDDGWTAVTKDRSRTAQFEHTLVVTEDGAEILTTA
jgi:methionyl aminopeptidase